MAETMGILGGIRERTYNQDLTGARMYGITPETQNRLFNPLSQLMSQGVNLAAVYLINHVMTNLVPPDRMQIWIIFAVITLIVTTGTQWLVLLIKPGQDELYEKWQTFDRRIAILNELLLMATIFLLLPFSHMEQRIFATAYVVGYIPMTIFADPGNVTMNRIATVLALGSFAVFLVIYGNGVEQVLALVVVAYGCFLFYAVGNIHRIITKSVAAQWEAERLSKELQLALIETAAERDAKTRFISTASHDLGQPLQAAKLFSEQVA